MQVDERLTLPAIEKDLSILAGMKVSRVWLGYADALFLECGRAGTGGDVSHSSTIRQVTPRT